MAGVCPGVIVTKAFGVGGHTGIDYGVACGTPIATTRRGTVTFAGGVARRGAVYGFGLHVKVAIGGGIELIFAHLSAVNVRVGDKLLIGYLVGTSGNTGHTEGPTGCHLHFEVRKNGVPINPDPYGCPIGYDLGKGAPVSPPDEAQFQKETAAAAVRRPFQTRCRPPGQSSGAPLDLSLLPLIGPAVTVGEGLSYVVCILFDYRTWIRVGFVAGGTYLTVYGLKNLSAEIGAPNVAAPLTAAVASVGRRAAPALARYKKRNIAKHAAAAGKGKEAAAAGKGKEAAA